MDKFDKLLFPLVEWVKGEEKRVLKKGKKLNKSQLKEAKKMGIEQYGKIRIFCVPEIMLPYGLDLVKLLIIFSAIPKKLNGLVLGYGIVLREDFKDDRELLIHEY